MSIPIAMIFGDDLIAQTYSTYLLFHQGGALHGAPIQSSVLAAIAHAHVANLTACLHSARHAAECHREDGGRWDGMSREEAEAEIAELEIPEVEAVYRDLEKLQPKIPESYCGDRLTDPRSWKLSLYRGIEFLLYHTIDSRCQDHLESEYRDTLMALHIFILKQLAGV